MNEIYQAKIGRFLEDATMVEAVFEQIRNSFLKEKGLRAVEIMAAERMAVDLLSVARKDLERLRLEKEETNGQLKQVGL